ncbi:hypothetical protein K1719_014921 [Acacia pycnantha]|nr:hypothetical protein K1719_014921 [Acacia pycnantha]
MSSLWDSRRMTEAKGGGDSRIRPKGPNSFEAKATIFAHLKPSENIFFCGSKQITAIVTTTSGVDLHRIPATLPTGNRSTYRCQWLPHIRSFGGRVNERTGDE